MSITDIGEVPITTHQWLKPLYVWLKAARVYLETPHFDTLFVGGDHRYYGYTGGHATWFDVDGVNPPTVAAMRFIDQITGLAKTVTIENGAWIIGPG